MFYDALRKRYGRGLLRCLLVFEGRLKGVGVFRVFGRILVFRRCFRVFMGG